MIRPFFVVSNLLLSLPFAVHGVLAYFEPLAGWDAGAVGLFAAFWFLFAAAGFRGKNPWMVTMAFLAMTAFTLLFLLIGFLESWNLRFAGPVSGTLLLVAAVALLVFLTAGEIYAVAAFRGRGGDEGGVDS